MGTNVSRLITLGAGGGVDGELELTRAHMTLGRSHSNDLVLTEPTVSRVHASLSVDPGGRVSVQDLGSSAGTTVNGRPASGPVVLHSGDVVSFGAARFQYQGASERSDATAALPVQREHQARPRDEHIQGQYDVENQNAETISNVAGNQYTAYVAHIRQERESFLRDVAATKTKARWLIWIGLGVTIVGLVVVGANFYEFVGGLPGYTGEGIPAAFRSYIMGIFIAGGGQILMIIGIVLHVVATSRRKRVDREFPLPRPRGY
ncbi:MAG: FHA domain-containing protein [Arthrobacter sp.]